MIARPENGSSRHDEAARAGWLYYVAGNTQDQIAAKLGVSRQSAQRLVSLAVSEGLIKVRLDHPIANCMELAERLRSRFALDRVEVVPSDPGSSSTTIGVAEAAAAEIERWLRSADADRAGDRHRPHAEGGDRAAVADGVPAAPGRVADRQHRARRLGGLLQRHFHDGRHDQGAQLPDAAAGHRLVAGGARDAAPPGDDQADARSGRQGRHHLRRHRRSRPDRAALSSTASSTRPSSRRCRRRAPSARSAAGRSTATAADRRHHQRPRRQRAACRRASARRWWRSPWASASCRRSARPWRAAWSTA